MKAGEEKLDIFISQKKTQFVIPVYQRNYNWERFHCKQLLDDILRVGVDDNINSHFIGSIVFIRDDIYSTGSRLTEFTIIDGQQRLTSITLIYLVLYHLAIKSKNIDLETEMNEDYLINKQVKVEKLKLRPTEDNDKALKFLLNPNMDTSKYPGFSRMIENYDYFDSRINEENIGVVIKGLAKLLFVYISMDRGKDDPQRIFESLNSTGLELSPADLIRNYILMGLKLEHQNKLYTDYWQPIEKFCTIAESNKNRVSDFIRDYLTIKKRDIPTKGAVYKEFKEEFSFLEYEMWESQLNDIKTYAGYYNKLINTKNEKDPEISREIYFINKMEINVSYPFLLEVYNDYEDQKIDKETFLAVLKLVQSYVWRRFIVGLPTNSLNRIFSKLYDDDVKQSDYLPSIQRALVKRSGNQRFPKNTEISAALKERDVYSFQPKNKMYFLERLENFKNREPVQIAGNSHITVEHIFPQNPDHAWFKELGEKTYKDMKENYLNTIANLTLSGNNGSLGNKVFKEKRDMSEKGYKDSRLFLNKYLSDIDQWGLEEIDQRYKIICDRFTKIWQFPEISLDETNIDEVNIFDADDPKGKKLDYFIFFDEKRQCNKVSEMYLYMINYLFTEEPHFFHNSDLGERIGLTKDKTKPRQAVKINGAWYIEGNHDNNNKFERLKNALTVFGLSDELIIKYANNDT